jgi:hypothetical protein
LSELAAQRPVGFRNSNVRPRPGSAREPSRRGDPGADTWPTAARLLPHALAIAANPTIDDAAPDATVDLLSRVADYLWNPAEYQQAEQRLYRSIAVADAPNGAQARI